MALRLNTSEKSEISDIRRFCVAFWELPSWALQTLTGTVKWCLEWSQEFAGKMVRKTASEKLATQSSQKKTGTRLSKFESLSVLMFFELRVKSCNVFVKS